MTVLILAHRKIKNLLPGNNFGNFSLNIPIPACLRGQVQRKFLFFGCLAISMAAMAVYLWSLYSVFQSGFTLREQEIFLDKLSRDIKLQEVRASNMETNLVTDSELMAGMEKVSSMRYIKTSSEVSYKP